MNAQFQSANHLKPVFSALVTPVLARYTELTGAGLVSSLQNDLNALARTNNWRISATSQGIVDTQVFETPEAAGRAYSVLIWVIITNMSAIIGIRMANDIVHDAAHQLEPTQFELLRKYHLVTGSILYYTQRLDEGKRGG